MKPKLNSEDLKAASDNFPGLFLILVNLIS